MAFIIKSVSFYEPTRCVALRKGAVTLKKWMTRELDLNNPFDSTDGVFYYNYLTDREKWTFYAKSFFGSSFLSGTHIDVKSE